MAQFFRGGWSGMPPVTKNLIIINALIWLVEVIQPQFGLNGIIRHLGLHYVGAPDFNPAQILTYMFVHDQKTFFHVFFNMFTLFFFGPWLERTWTSKRFFIFYMVCGIGAALVQEAVWALEWNKVYEEYVAWFAGVNHVSLSDASSEVSRLIAERHPEMMAAMDQLKNSMVTVGASGAIFGVLLAFGYLYPRRPLYLMFIPVPIQARWVVIGYGVLELLQGVGNRPDDNVAHFAHLGGMLIGFLLLYFWKKKGLLNVHWF